MGMDRCIRKKIENVLDFIKMDFFYENLVSLSLEASSC
jgi:hypothetical protein